MKAEINNDNKMKFFGLYIGQSVMKYSKNPSFNHNVDSTLFSDTIKDKFLELKPISSISDEDAIDYFDILWAKIGSHKDKSIDFKIEYGKEWALCANSERFGLIPSDLLHGIDYLKYKGYLLPWMGLSPEEIINAGWAKYKE